MIDFLSALAFSSALVISIGLALPRLRRFRSLPQFRLLLTRFLSPGILNKFDPPKPAANPVYWSIGSKLKSQQSFESGSWVQVFSNGDVYEGEFHKGKCSGSGVYYYSMSGKYEGDWIDEKYDGYGVETWARGSRYRGQYRKGLRHGIGVYRFYSGDVYAGEWSSGQSHGFGAYTCEDGSKYVGEFKWGVKHGFGRYHFRYVFFIYCKMCLNLLHGECNYFSLLFIRCQLGLFHKGFIYLCCKLNQLYSAVVIF